MKDNKPVFFFGTINCWITRSKRHYCCLKAAVIRDSLQGQSDTVTDSVPQTCDDDDDDDTVVVCEGRNSQLSGRAWS